MLTAPKLNPSGLYRHLPLEPHHMTDAVTRVEDSIVLCHLGVPRIATEDWALSISGLVRKPSVLRFQDLLAKPHTRIEAVHQCAGNPLQPDAPSRRVCNVVWSGVRLAELIRDCEPQPEAKFVWSRGADYGIFEGVHCDTYLKDIPLVRLADDVLIALEMNGAPLRAENGFPARLVVPGFYGTNSVKWITNIELADRRPPGPFVTRWYNDPVRDKSGSFTGKTTPVWSIAPQSVIVRPVPNEVLNVGTEINVWGWAWGDGGIKTIELSFDSGMSWRHAAIVPGASRAWQRYSLAWTPDSAGEHCIMARATGAGGSVQPLDGARNAIHDVRVVAVHGPASIR